MSAVAELSKPDTAVLFTAVREDLRLTKVPRYPIFGPGGRAVGEEPGQALRFRNGVLRVSEDGAELAEGGILPRDEALAWLRAHRLYGDPQEGFTEVRPAAPPVSEAELAAVLEAAVDVDALREIIAAEEAGWDREALLRPARAQLQRVLDKIEEIQQAAPKRAAK